MDDAKLKELGWVPRVKWDDGIKGVIEWYKSKCNIGPILLRESLSTLVCMYLYMYTILTYVRTGIHVFTHVYNTYIRTYRHGQGALE